MQRHILLQSPDARNTLKQIAEAIWHPLGHLPENLTIVLTPI
jgi:hypothetical protein